MLEAATAFATNSLPSKPAPALTRPTVASSCSSCRPVPPRNQQPGASHEAGISASVAASAAALGAASSVAAVTRHPKRGSRRLRRVICHQRLPKLEIGSMQDCGAETDPGDLAAEVRKDFKGLSAEAHHGVPLVYFDNGATSQKPRCVLEALDRYYESSANVHRGIHALAEQATEAFEASRRSIARFLNAASENEIVFTSGATEAINLVANSWGASQLQEGDEVILTCMEHHSNIVPWQLLAERLGLKLHYAGITANGELDVGHLESLITPRTRMIALAHVSNVLGCINPAKRVVQLAHEVGAVVLLDACQSVPHLPIDVQDLGVDFLAASGHKMCGPTGIGFLWGLREVLEEMPPWKGGGEMIKAVTLEGSTYAEIPSRFEAGTPPIAEAVGLGAACEYLMGIGMDRIQAYEAKLGAHLWNSLAAIPDLKLYGPPPGTAGRAALVAFNDTQPDVYPADLALLLDEEGFAIRAGHHCTQPLHSELGAVYGSARASLSFYNTFEEVDAFVASVRENLELLRAGEGCVFDPDDPDSCYCASDRMRS